MIRDRDSAWAWVALAIAVVAAMVAAPWDASIRNVRIDGTVAADGSTTATGEEGATTDALSGSTSTDAGSSSSSSGGSSTTNGTSTGSSGTSGSSAGSSGSSTSGSGSASSNSGTSSGSTGNTGNTGSTGSSGGNESPPATPPGTGGVGENGKGVSDTQVRIGFTELVGQQDAAGQLGFSEAAPTPGNTKEQIQALVAWANANGGLAGREIVPIIKEIRQLESTDEGEQAICTSFAEDQGQDVFAALLIGTIREQMRQCLADNGIITLDSSSYPLTGYLFDQTVVDGIPYLWSPSYPTVNDVGEHLADHLDALGFFEPGIRPNDPCVVEPCNVGIVMYDFPNYNRALEEVYQPRFEAIGHPIVSVHRVDSRDAGTIEGGLTAAVIGLQRDQVSRVLFMGGAPLGVFFQINAANSGYRPAYGMSSFDQPRFSTDNANAAPEQAHGMRGIGFVPTLDVHDDEFVRSNPMEQQCLQILSDAGIEFANRANARIAMAYCQGIMMLRHVGERTGPDLTARSWTSGAVNLGESFQTIDGFHVTFSANRRAGSDQFRRFQVDSECYCNKYVSDLFAFTRR